MDSVSQIKSNTVTYLKDSLEEMGMLGRGIKSLGSGVFTGLKYGYYGFKIPFKIMYYTASNFKDFLHDTDIENDKFMLIETLNEAYKNISLNVNNFFEKHKYDIYDFITKENFTDSIMYSTRFHISLPQIIDQVSFLNFSKISYEELDKVLINAVEVANMYNKSLDDILDIDNLYDLVSSKFMYDSQLLSLVNNINDTIYSTEKYSVESNKTIQTFMQYILDHQARNADFKRLGLVKGYYELGKNSLWYLYNNVLYLKQQYDNYTSQIPFLKEGLDFVTPAYIKNILNLIDFFRVEKIDLNSPQFIYQLNNHIKKIYEYNINNNYYK